MVAAPGPPYAQKSPCFKSIGSLAQTRSLDGARLQLDFRMFQHLQTLTDELAAAVSCFFNLDLTWSVRQARHFEAGEHRPHGAAARKAAPVERQDLPGAASSVLFDGPTRRPLPPWSSGGHAAAIAPVVELRQAARLFFLGAFVTEERDVFAIDVILHVEVGR